LHRDVTAGLHCLGAKHRIDLRHGSRYGPTPLVPGAKVTLINEASKATRDTTSNGEGFFNFLAVQPATYTIRVQRAGFETWKVTGVEVHPGDSLTVPKINLKVGAIAESVTVTAEVAGVTLDSPEHSTMITSADIARLSTTGRDALELVSMLPGFTLNAGTGLNNQGADYNTTSFNSGNLGSYGANGPLPSRARSTWCPMVAQVDRSGDMERQRRISHWTRCRRSRCKPPTSAPTRPGAIVINAVGKSGGAVYHGGSTCTPATTSSTPTTGCRTTPASPRHPRNTTIPAPPSAAGHDPGHSFNESKRLTFWAGFEYYDQLNNTNGTYGGPTTRLFRPHRCWGAIFPRLRSLRHSCETPPIWPQVAPKTTASRLPFPISAATASLPQTGPSTRTARPVNGAC